MRPALAFVPGRSPLHRANPGPAIAFLGALAMVAFVFSSPLVLVAAGVAIALAGVMAGAGRAVAASLRLAAPLMLLMVLVNALVSHRGETVLLRGWNMPVLGNTDVTLESLAAGGAIGLRVVVVVLAFAVYSACVDPDRVLRALRPVAQRSALTAALVARLVPMAAADGARLREAAELRGPGAEPVGRAALARRLVESSLDRAVDAAATLELRGHSLGVRPRSASEPSRDDLPLLLSGASILGATVAARLAGAGGFETYPRIELAADPATLALCVALPVLAAAPFALQRLRAAGSRAWRRAPIPEARRA
jgi:energy-coupling factor transporter transmembrane protein EcfT